MSECYMNRTHDEIRCTYCGALHGIAEAGGLTIRRGDYEIHIHGNFQTSVVCHRDRCRRLNLRRFTDRHAAQEAHA